MSNRPTTRMNISVPEDLREEMATVSNVNWSAVACDAFRAKLTATVKESEMSDLVTRLKAQKSQNRDEAFQDGQKWGKEWATENATYEQLFRLTRSQERLLPYNNWDLVFDEDASPAIYLCDVIDGEENNSWSIARDFWVDIGLEDPEEMDNGWFQGFADGAIEVFESVRDLL